MRDKVRIAVKGTQHDLSGETTEVTYSGRYRYAAGKHLVAYDEYPAGGDGAQIKSANLVKIDGDSVAITKKGAVSTQMYFESGKEHTCVYQTPFGSFDMMIQTSGLSVEETGEMIAVTINYVLCLDGGKVSDCTVEMRIFPEQ